MRTIVWLERGVCVVLAACFLAVSPAVARAGLVTTERVLEQGARDRVLAQLERADVREQLAAFGIGADEARRRVAALSDAEIARIHERIDSLPAGGNGGWIGIVAIVLVALAITDYFGLTDIYPWIGPEDRPQNPRY